MRFIVFRHAPAEGLGSIAHWLDLKGHTYFYVDLFRQQNPPPALVLNYDGLILMGGPQSVNDTKTYPEVAHTLRAAQLFLSARKPILGICLGAQAIAKALGAKVYQSAFEFGFQKVKVHPHEMTEGLGEVLECFQWHGENFELPQGATKLFSGDVVANQGFAWEKALAMQFHMELNEGLYEAWREELKREKRDDLLTRMPPREDALRRLKSMESMLVKLLDNWLACAT
ncbi:MAG: type 1 glutamine amidotransferase [Leptospiraceae bacterium]|nr:type 1 glutamine amidotransferase [Leptospiraceae bacterium]